MDLFITSLVIYGALLLVLAAPLWYVSWRRDRLTVARNCLIGAAVVDVCCATLAVVSERQVLQCIGAGNAECFDSGAAGMQLLFVALFGATAWFNAYFMWRD